MESIQWGSTWPALAEEHERRRILSYMEDRFGIPASVFHGYLFLRRKDTWRIIRNSEHLGKAAHLKVESVGIKGFHLIGEFIKPSTRLIQMFGGHAVKARMELGQAELCSLAGGIEIPADPRLENGYVILCSRGQPLGLGLIIRGMLRSQIPKSESRFFSQAH